MENVQVGLGDLEEKVQDEVPRKDEADVILARINADLIALSKIAPLVSFLPCQMDRFADSADGRTWTSSEKMTSTLGCASFSSGIVRWSLKFDVAGTDSFWGLKSASGRECSSLGWNAPQKPNTMLSWVLETDFFTNKARFYSGDGKRVLDERNLVAEVRHCNNDDTQEQFVGLCSCVCGCVVCGVYVLTVGTEL